jgi:hypothetical protein
MKRWLFVLALACGGSADDADHPEPGWCCDGICGLTGIESSVFATCSCDAVVRRSEAQRGECTAEP